MSNNNDTQKTYNHASNKQEKLANIQNSVQVNHGSINQSHNSDKEGLGGNTRR